MKSTPRTRMAGALFSGLFALSVVGAYSGPAEFVGGFIGNISFVSTAEAKGRKGGAKRHAHKGHHGGGGGRPHNRPSHKPNHKPGNGNHHHHHNNDNWHHHYKHHNYYDHYGRWVAGGVAAGVTAAAIGSIVYSLPRGCREFVSGGVRYWDCGGVYYQARYRGSDLTYVVVDRP